MSDEQWTPTFEKPAAMCPRCNWPLSEKRAELAGTGEREQRIRERVAAMPDWARKASDFPYLLDALDAARAENERYRVALNDLWQSLHEGEDGELFEDFNEERWAQFNAAYAQAGIALVRGPVSPASEGDLRRAQRLEVAVHDALEQLDQDMPLLAGVTLLLAVVEAPQQEPRGGE